MYVCVCCVLCLERENWPQKQHPNQLWLENHRGMGSFQLQHCCRAWCHWSSCCLANTKVDWGNPAWGFLEQSAHHWSTREALPRRDCLRSSHPLLSNCKGSCSLPSYWRRFRSCGHKNWEQGSVIGNSSSRGKGYSPDIRVCPSWGVDVLRRKTWSCKVGSDGGVLPWRAGNEAAEPSTRGDGGRWVVEDGCCRLRERDGRPRKLGRSHCGHPGTRCRVLRIEGRSVVDVEDRIRHLYGGGAGGNYPRDYLVACAGGVEPGYVLGVCVQSEWTIRIGGDCAPEWYDSLIGRDIEYIQLDEKKKDRKRVGGSNGKCQRDAGDCVEHRITALTRQTHRPIAGSRANCHDKGSAHCVGIVTATRKAVLGSVQRAVIRKIGLPFSAEGEKSYFLCMECVLRRTRCTVVARGCKEGDTQCAEFRKLNFGSSYHAALVRCKRGSRCMPLLREGSWDLECPPKMSDRPTVARWRTWRMSWAPPFLYAFRFSWLSKKVEDTYPLRWCTGYRGRFRWHHKSEDNWHCHGRWWSRPKDYRFVETP